MYQEKCGASSVLSEINKGNHSQTHLFIVIIPVHIQQLSVKHDFLTFTVIGCWLHSPHIVGACAGVATSLHSLKVVGGFSPQTPVRTMLRL